MTPQNGTTKSSMKKGTTEYIIDRFVEQRHTSKWTMYHLRWYKQSTDKYTREPESNSPKQYFTRYWRAEVANVKKRQGRRTLN